jgi:hypothetical protein
MDDTETIPNKRLMNARKIPIPMYNHSLLKILHVLSITRRKPVLPVVSAVDDMRYNLKVVNNALRKVE